ncbi:hypothetical protein, partial [Bradyrhizobium manausense]|uniref:hypothetical protein n=1 Tax=Bradyrhizobium manausense TaxID=989370 RepID=UPI001BAD8BE1
MPLQYPSILYTAAVETFEHLHERNDRKVNGRRTRGENDRIVKVGRDSAPAGLMPGARGRRNYSAASLCPSRAFSLRISSSAASAITVP